VALTIDNPRVEELATEVANLTGESTTEAILQALEQRKLRLGLTREPSERLAGWLHWLETEVWSKIPPEQRGRPIPREEQDQILGYGPNGV
jgi:antitoxin VapB